MNLYEAFRLGNRTQYLRFLPSKSSIHGERRILDAIEGITSQLEKDNMNITTKDKLIKWKEYLLENYKEEDAQINDADRKKIIVEANDWRTDISSALNTALYIRIQTQTGLNPLELQKISNNQPSEFITEAVLNKLTDIEKSDFSDSAKCLLLGTATPSVMVALRGAEASLRNYYFQITQNDPGKKTWRQITKDLRDNANTLGIEETFIGFLDYIGDAKRNFAQHPNKTYSLREAVMIFIQVMATIEDIYKGL